MKKIFTLLLSFACSLFLSKPALSQCNYSVGADGSSLAISNPITIDGNMADWSFYLNDPDNNSYDNTNNVDMDAPIADAGRNLTRLAFTEDMQNLYLYLERAGSVNNSIDIIYYVDINNNGMMEYREPVVVMNWNGANRNVSLSIYDYIPSAANVLFNNLEQNLDGSSLMGTLSHRVNIGSTGKGSADGRSAEIQIPFLDLTTLDVSGNITDQLTFGKDFKFHISTINGNVASIPNQNSINDNFGGCLKAPLITLPVHLISFGGNLNKNNKVTLNWTAATNETVAHFEVERSINGKDFTTVAMVFATEKYGTEDYMYYETINSNDKVMYRLKMFDKGQDIDYSKILVFQSKTSNTNEIKIYGNPVNDKLTFSYASNETQTVSVKVYDLVGKVLMSQKINSLQGINMMSIPLRSTFKPGLYVAEVTNGSDRQIAKFVKQ
jgi:hypothetical protein